MGGSCSLSCEAIWRRLSNGASAIDDTMCRTLTVVRFCRSLASAALPSFDARKNKPPIDSAAVAAAMPTSSDTNTLSGSLHERLPARDGPHERLRDATSFSADSDHSLDCNSTSSIATTLLHPCETAARHEHEPLWRFHEHDHV